MSRYISLETIYRALDEIDRQAIKGEEWNVKCITNRIRSIRFYTEDPQEVRHGRWESVQNGCVCSVCGKRKEQGSDNFCANCGAKMQEDK